MSTSEPTARTLSATEARLVLDLEWHEEKVISLARLRATLGVSDAHARLLAHKLVKKGWLERMKPGLYHFIPASRGPQGVPDSNPFLVASLLPKPSFFSFGTACTHHGFTEQVFAQMYVACRTTRRPLAIRGKCFIFVQLSAPRFFGHQTVSIFGLPVVMATPERALLDALDRPRYAGGIGEVSRMLSRAIPRISWPQLLNLATRWKQSALVQRLGYFLDLHQIEIPQRIRASLRKLLRPGNKVFLGARGQWGTSGPLDTSWNVVQNVPREFLIERDQPRRHRIVFSDQRSRS